MSTGEIGHQVFNDLLAVEKGPDRQHKLGEECDPHQEQHGENTGQVHQDVKDARLHAPHTQDLPAIQNQQDRQPCGNVKPWSLGEGSFVHAHEFYNKTL